MISFVRMTATAVGLQLILAVLSVCTAAVPDPPEGVVGVRKYATNLHDCNGPVAFSSASAIAPIKEDRGKLGYRKVLIDKGVGWSRESGEFTCFCPGLYQFAFAGSGKTAVTRLVIIHYIIIYRTSRYESEALRLWSQRCKTAKLTQRYISSLQVQL
jgi:hypothetical protein